MIEIIGKDPKHMKQCSCRKCSSILKYTEDEVRRQIVHDYGGGREVEKTIICPACGYKINVS